MSRLYRRFDVREFGTIAAGGKGIRAFESAAEATYHPCMYTPAAFREDDPAVIRQMISDAPFATLVTGTAEGLVATPLPLFLAQEEGQTVLYGHVARANPQWKLAVTGEALAIFTGPDAYITPSWYVSKREHGKVVPTWNYLAVHAYGAVEFFEDAGRLLEVVTRLTQLHEAPRSAPWAVSDAPADFIASQLKGVVGVRLEVSRLEAKRKLSQNRNAADRGVSRKDWRKTMMQVRVRWAR